VGDHTHRVFLLSLLTQPAGCSGGAQETGGPDGAVAAGAQAIAGAVAPSSASVKSFMD
jgi:hypothetical protein